ncbi:MAG: 3-dehydroquinate synthase, partial [Methylocystaceae bacterium]
AILNREAEPLLEIIDRCCSIKAKIVAQDEKEHGERALLNLGHTFGHAFETLSAYTYNHGEAVAVGMIYASRLAYNQGLLQLNDCLRIETLVAEYGLPTQVAGINLDEVVAAMHRDKKSRHGQLQLVLPTAIGAAVLTNAVTDEEISQVLDN